MFLQECLNARKYIAAVLALNNNWLFIITGNKINRSFLRFWNSINLNTGIVDVHTDEKMWLLKDTRKTEVHQTESESK